MTCGAKWFSLLLWLEQVRHGGDKTDFQLFRQHAYVWLREYLLMLARNFINLEPALSALSPAVINRMDVAIVGVFCSEKRDLTLIWPQRVT